MFVRETASKQLGYFQKAYLLACCNTVLNHQSVQFEMKLKKLSGFSFISVLRAALVNSVRFTMYFPSAAANTMTVYTTISHVAYVVKVKTRNG